MQHTGNFKVIDTIVTVKIKGKVRTVEVHPDQWEKHKEQIRAYVAGSDIEVDDGIWCHANNPQWHIHKNYRVKVTKQPEAAQIWKNALGNYLLYSEDSGMVNLDTGFTHPEYDLERLTFVCSSYTQIPR